MSEVVGIRPDFDKKMNGDMQFYVPYFEGKYFDPANWTMGKLIHNLEGIFLFLRFISS